MKTYFCWRCNRDMPFLDEAEWQQVAPLLTGAIQAIQAYRVEHQCDLQTARQHCKPEAMTTFEALTGMPGIHFARSTTIDCRIGAQSARGAATCFGHRKQGTASTAVWIGFEGTMTLRNERGGK